jgi:hypothetical protein
MKMADDRAAAVVGDHLGECEIRVAIVAGNVDFPRNARGAMKTDGQDLGAQAEDLAVAESHHDPAGARVHEHNQVADGAVDLVRDQRDDAVIARRMQVKRLPQRSPFATADRRRDARRKPAPAGEKARAERRHALRSKCPARHREPP